jgi:hypothetical protein
MTDELTFDSRQREETIPFPKESRQAQDPKQPPIQWKTGSLSQEIRRPERQGSHSHLYSAKFQNKVRL